VSGETWAVINDYLIKGGRTLEGGSSLPKLLAEKRGVRNKQDLPPHTTEKILAWADAHHERTGEWPNQTSGPIIGAPGETWRGVHLALLQGLRSLDGGSSLARLLARYRGVRNSQGLPNLTVQQVLEWADVHRERTGKVKSGLISEAPEERWASVDNALRIGLRGLSGGSSLGRLIEEHRGSNTN
jgi:hypothetical protein